MWETKSGPIFGYWANTSENNSYLGCTLQYRIYITIKSYIRIYIVAKTWKLEYVGVGTSKPFHFLEWTVGNFYSCQVNLAFALNISMWLHVDCQVTLQFQLLFLIPVVI